MSILVETFGTEKVDPLKLVDRGAARCSTCAPAAILRDLDLRRPIYRNTAAYGHFGRTGEAGEFPWENLDRVDDLKSALGL